MKNVPLIVHRFYACVCVLAVRQRHHIIPPYCMGKPSAESCRVVCTLLPDLLMETVWVELELTGIASLESLILACSLPVFSKIAEKLRPRWFQRKYFTKSLAECSRQRARESGEISSHPDR